MELKKPSICASIIAHSVDEFLEALEKVNVEQADLVELRADGLKASDHGGNYKSLVKVLLKRAKSVEIPLILTVRREKEGGVFTGTEAERIDCIKGCMKLADVVDIELRTNEEGRDEIIEIARSSNVPIILSYHDFKKTPGEDVMKSLLGQAENLGASVAKLGVTPNSRADVVKLLNVTQEMSGQLDIPICTISMGKRGAISRIAAPVFGSAITYGYVTRETAPGQMSVSDLHSILGKMGLRA